MADHFFEPGAEYDDATGYSAPETIRTFRCVAVAAMPDTGEPVAFGFMHSTALGWGGTGMGISHWRQGWNRTSPAPEREPSEGPKALAEANEREKARQAAMSPEELWRYRQEQAARAHETLGKASPSEVAARLRGHGLTEAPEFFESVQPVTPRDRVVGRGEPGER